MRDERDGRRTASVGETTRERILDVAERLFAQNGPEAVSVRAIATAAGVNLAAINYHFGTKERMFEDVFRRRVIPLNEQRLALLEAAVAEAGPGGVPSVEAILTAFVTPPLRFATEAAGSARALVVMQFLGHVFSSPNEGALVETYYDEVRTRFIALLHRALPHLSIDDVLWRYNFTVGAIIYAMGGPARMKRLPTGLSAQPVRSDEHDDGAAIRELVAFATTGFRAPPAAPPAALLPAADAAGKRRGARGGSPSA